MKVGVVYMNLYVSKCLREELAWATDKQLWVLVIKCYLKLLYHKETKEKSRFKYKKILYMLLCDP